MPPPPTPPPIPGLGMFGNGLGLGIIGILGLFGHFPLIPFIIPPMIPPMPLRLLPSLSPLATSSSPKVGCSVSVSPLQPLHLLVFLPPPFSPSHPTSKFKKKIYKKMS